MNNYLRFLLSEAQIDEAGGFVDAAMRRAGSRIKHSALNAIGGNNTSFGAKSDGALEQMDIAAALRKEWFRYSGKLNGTAQAQPTPNNIKNWLKSQFNVDVDVSLKDTVEPGKAEPEQDSEEAEDSEAEDSEQDSSSVEPPKIEPSAEILSIEDRLRSFFQTNPTAEDVSQYMDQLVSYIEDLNAFRKKNKLNALDEKEIVEKIEAANHGLSVLKHHDVDDTLYSSKQADQSETDVLQYYIANGMGVKGFKPNPNVLLSGAAGRNDDQYQQYLLRFLQAAAGPNTVNPITKGKPLSVDTPVGGAMRMMTIALSKNDEDAVLQSIQNLKKAVLTDFADKPVAEHYFTGLKNDPVLVKKFPKMVDAIENEVLAEQVPFEKLYRQVFGKLFLFKDPRSKPSAQQRMEFMDGLAELIARAEKGTADEKNKIRNVMEPLQSDAMVDKIPGMGRIIARYKESLAETALSPYVSFLLETTGVSLYEAAGDEVLNRVDFDALFKNISQQLIAGGKINYGNGNDSIVGDDDTEHHIAVSHNKIDPRKIAMMAAAFNISFPHKEIERVINICSGNSIKKITNAINKLSYDKVIAMNVSLALTYVEQPDFNYEHYRDDIIDTAAHMEQKISHSYSRFTPIFSGMKEKSRRGLEAAFRDMPEEESRAFCMAMGALLGSSH